MVFFAPQTYPSNFAIFLTMPPKSIQGSRQAKLKAMNESTQLSQPEFCKLQRNILNKLGYFGVSTTRIFLQEGQAPVSSVNWSRSFYLLEGNTVVGKVFFWTLKLNAVVKAIFLGLLVLGCFGPIEFLDEIAALDYILCFGLVVLTDCIWFRRYLFYEIIQAKWKVLNDIFVRLGSPYALISGVDHAQKMILIQHSAIIWIGCFCLLIQYFADPKYCTFTYSIFKVDSGPLRFLFGAHEFLFMNLAWNTYAGSCSLCIFQGITLSRIIREMGNTIQSLFHKSAILRKGTVMTERNEYNINDILLDYKKLTIICNQFNEWVNYKTLFMHVCGGCQFVSDVFAATHVLKGGDAGFMDVWFYIEDCFAAGFMLVRTYMFMALVSTASHQFLVTLHQYLTSFRSRRKNGELWKIGRSLKALSLKVGPCSISPISVLAVLDTMGNYYVCAALWP